MPEIKVLRDPQFEHEGKMGTVYGRWREIEGLWYPSVTTIISPTHAYAPKESESYLSLTEKLALKKGSEGKGKTLTEYRDAAAERGSEMHNLCERIDQGETVNLDELNADMRKDVAAYIEHVKAFKPQQQYTEFEVYSNVYGFSGRLDQLACVDGKWHLLDKKSGRKVKPSAGWQLSAYGLACREMGLVESEWETKYEVQQIREGKVTSFLYSHYDWLIYSFLTALQTWKALNWNWGLFKLHLAGKYPWLKQCAAHDYVAANRDKFAEMGVK